MSSIGRPSGFAWLLAVGALAVVGCGGGGPKAPKPVPVSGTVYLDGKPLANATVRFNSATFMGEGKTNDQGKYELVQGASPGDNVITVSQTIEGLNPEEGMDLEQMAAAGGVPPGMKAPPKSIIPADYGDPSKSNIKFNVPEGGTDGADFRLQMSGP